MQGWEKTDVTQRRAMLVAHAHLGVADKTVVMVPALTSEAWSSALCPQEPKEQGISCSPGEGGLATTLVEVAF